MVESFFSYLWAITSYWVESHLESCQTSTMELSCEITNGFNTLTISERRLHHRCSTDLSEFVSLRLKVLSMWDMDGLQVYRICSRRLVYSYVVEARSNYKKSYLWWFKNPACGDWTGSNGIEKNWVGLPPGLVWEKGGGAVVWFSVSEAPLDD